MFDTMTFTKVLGAVCGSLLIFMLGKWAADELYAVGGGHGYGEEHAAGYLIEVEDSGEEEVVEEGPAFSELLASADIGSGAKVFKKCSACHSLEKGENKTGPYLYGVVGRAVDAAEGFGYSEALAAVGDAWTVDALNAFLENPRKAAPGTSMSFSGLKKETDRADLIAYLDSLDD
ncbi:cytochrome c family protein [uncultured Lentibacter sp.]|uniref:c-type cytochrome n=1 Tax=uncultured Lentibacter sp. TaxID=1659309 RepID=UPI00260D977A|nr:cytochrome c family protein [uncultured Lentibacter sp.]